jgi:5-methylcytosine-specific restriction endonuclease McrA
MTGKCYVCERPISFTTFEVGHNRPFAKGSKWNINNLRPICGVCNRSMGTMTIEAFKKRYFEALRKKAKHKRSKAKHRRKRSLNQSSANATLLFTITNSPMTCDDQET